MRTDTHSPQSHYARSKALFEEMDRTRCQRGEVLACAGFGPIETPYRIVHAAPGVHLRRYGEEENTGPVMLIVPAPIKRPYIWDLAPHISVVRACLKQGMRVYLAEWTPVPAAGQDVGLADYGERLLKGCLDAIAVESKARQVILAGHSLGGVLATIYAAMHPQQVAALLLLEAPLHFGADAGNFAPLVAATPNARPIETSFDNVPGSFLNFVSAAAAPRAFHWERYLDWSLSLHHAQAFKTHMQVVRWMHDEFPLPGKLFAEIVELLYRQDQLMQGTLCIGNRTIGPHAVKAPLLTVIDPRSSVIPPQAILPFQTAATSTFKKVLQYQGDIGVGIQHVGVLVGTKAHAVIWPAIFNWLADTGVMHRDTLQVDQAAGQHHVM